MTATLHIGPLVWSGWESITIKMGLEQAARSFQFGAADGPLGASLEAIRIGLPCQVRIDGEPVVTGFIEEIGDSFDKESSSVDVAGRSRTCDIIDCSALHASGQWTMRPLMQIAAELLAPFGLTVSADPTAAEAVALPLQRFALEPGETVYEALERAARIASVLITDDALGNLVFTRASALRATTPLVAGLNVKAGGGKASSEKVFNAYHCRGQRPGNDLDNGPTVALVAGTALDTALPRHRPLVVKMEGAADPARCQQRAEWEATTRLGQSVNREYVVPGWRQEDGRLWTPNQLAYVHDPRGRTVGNLLITEVELSLSNDGGEVARMQLAPPEGFLPLAPAAKPKGRAASKAWIEDGVVKLLEKVW